MPIYFKKQVQIEDQIKTQIKAKSGAQIRALLFNKAVTEILLEYSNYSSVFSTKNAAELSKNIGINKYAIELEENKHLFLKTYL